MNSIDIIARCAREMDSAGFCLSDSDVRDEFIATYGEAVVNAADNLLNDAHDMSLY